MLFLLVMALTLMWKNAYAINEMLNNPTDIRTKSRHPEMKGVKHGDQLMTITFNDEFKDPMYRELDDRITKLEEEKDDEDEDDGDIVVRI